LLVLHSTVLPAPCFPFLKQNDQLLKRYTLKKASIEAHMLPCAVPQQAFNSMQTKPCNHSMQRHRADTACKHNMQRQRANTGCKDSMQIQHAHSMTLIQIPPRQQRAQLCLLDVQADSRLCFLDVPADSQLCFLDVPADSRLCFLDV